VNPEIEIRLERGDRVTAQWGDHALPTDQDGSAPAPFDLFLASIATCVGFYVSRFCRKREIDPQGVRIVQRATVEPGTHHVARIQIDIALPSGFPERYRDAVLRAAGQCAVKQHLERPPAIDVALTADAPT
jgi:ribosomal protein S12 methylthiotransferase accessory factor